MANNRQLKKAICRSCGQIAGEALVAQAAMDYKDAEKWDDIVINAAMLQVAALKRVAPAFGKKVKEFESKKAYNKARYLFYKENEKAVSEFMKEEVGKIVAQMNALLPKK